MASGTRGVPMYRLPLSPWILTSRRLGRSVQTAQSPQEVKRGTRNRTLSQLPGVTSPCTLREGAAAVNTSHPPASLRQCTPSRLFSSRSSRSPPRSAARGAEAAFQPYITRAHACLHRPISHKSNSATVSCRIMKAPAECARTNQHGHRYGRNLSHPVAMQPRCLDGGHSGPRLDESSC